MISSDKEDYVSSKKRLFSLSEEESDGTSPPHVKKINNYDTYVKNVYT